MAQITLTFIAHSEAEAKAIIDRVKDQPTITDEHIHEYLVRKGWWKGGTLTEGPKRDMSELITEEEARLEQAAKSTDVKRKNVSPGTPLIGKIGSTAKEVILETLREGQQPSTKYAEHMKLLWSRGEVKFDGQEYYL